MFPSAQARYVDVALIAVHDLALSRLDDVHELSICSAIAKIAHDAAAGRTVECVRVDIGYLRQVVPDTLRYSWEMVVFGTDLDGVPLEVNEVPAIIECRRCRTHTSLDDPIFRCAACGSIETDVISGNELLVTSLDVVK